MTSVLTIDGKEYVPATIAGKKFGYTKDYLLLRIKQGFIEGQKIGNKWYVHLPSAEGYFKNAKDEQLARRRSLSIERREEIKKHEQTKKLHGRHTALAETLVIVVIGLSVGATGYLGTAGNTQQASVHESFFASLAKSLYSFISPQTEVVHIAVSAPTTTPVNAISACVATTTHTSLIVAPDELFTATTVDEIRDSFSDPVSVSVDPENPDTGIITPVFKNEREGDNYRFLLVPVKT